MDIEKIKIRKSQNTLTGVGITLLIVMGIFIGLYLFILGNVQNAGVTLDSKYSESYKNITETQSTLHNNIEDIRTNLNKVIEAESAIQVAWNGLKGLGNTLKLPISFLSSAQTTYQSIIPTLSFLPSWVTPLVFTGILLFVVFLLLKVLKGEPNM